ncbi:MAG: GAF domain-containing protein [Proteocatella sp.]
MSFNFSEIFKEQPKSVIYDELYKMAGGLFQDERDMLANMGNISSLLYFNLENINWAGFYLYKNAELVLGPFNGKVACTRIAMGRGVCGSSAKENKIQIVEDVHEFPGHIACDSASNSEIVIPLYKDGKLLGVLDIDSTEKANFDEEDAKGLEKIVQLLIQKTDINIL